MKYFKDKKRFKLWQWIVSKLPFLRTTDVYIVQDKNSNTKVKKRKSKKVRGKPSNLIIKKHR